MKFHKFENIEELQIALKKLIVLMINEAIAKYDSAHILLSGGSTPAALYKMLGEEDLDWDKTVIGLVDERFVAPTSYQSNERLLRSAFNGSGVRIIPMVNDIESYENNLLLATKDYSIFEDRIDVCLLGMGTDGHTASLFPDDESSDQALALNYPNILANTNAPVEPIKRISASRKLIVSSQNLLLMITGERKHEVFTEALKNDLPISRFVENGTDLTVYYAEKG